MHARLRAKMATKRDYFNTLREMIGCCHHLLVSGFTSSGNFFKNTEHESLFKGTFSLKIFQRNKKISTTANHVTCKMANNSMIISKSSAGLVMARVAWRDGKAVTG